MSKTTPATSWTRRDPGSALPLAQRPRPRDRRGQPDRRRRSDRHAPRLIAPREPEHDYSVDHHDGSLIILTNSAGAEDYRIVEAPADSPGRENWREIEPHSRAGSFSTIVAFKDFLVRLEREDGLPRIVVRRFADGEGARDRLRRRSLRARHLARLRIRHAARCASPIRR